MKRILKMVESGICVLLIVVLKSSVVVRMMGEN